MNVKTSFLHCDFNEELLYAPTGRVYSKWKRTF
jgi:hypothetical protein